MKAMSWKIKRLFYFCSSFCVACCLVSFLPEHTHIFSLFSFLLTVNVLLSHFSSDAPSSLSSLYKPFLFIPLFTFWSQGCIIQRPHLDWPLSLSLSLAVRLEKLSWHVLSFILSLYLSIWLSLSLSLALSLNTSFSPPSSHSSQESSHIVIWWQLPSTKHRNLFS